ncbi:MAG: hypothetical protein M1826_000129 [Phylliscum demangeonii]|nr:MAG: hypothetical protein M1826_000129 [Phylliscum demangeonii]
MEHKTLPATVRTASGQQQRESGRHDQTQGIVQFRFEPLDPSDGRARGAGRAAADGELWAADL